jgi:DeoR family suf operon transcriptional repressor
LHLPDDYTPLSPAVNPRIKQTSICKNKYPGYNEGVKTSRQLLLEHLQLKRTASADELARALRVTPANIRHHLSALQSEGIVERIGQRPASGRGRPVQLFSLVDQVSRNNLALLTKALLSELDNGCTNFEREALLTRLAVRLLGAERRLVRNLAQRYFQAIQHLNTLNYQARWEAHAEAPHVIFSHCPFAAVIQDHPELCQLDKYILEELLGEEAVQTAKLDITPQGARQCIFLVGI